MAHNNTSDFIDIKGLFKTYLSKWYYFLISIVACGLLAVVYVKVKKPVYNVRANVLISQEDPGMGSFGGLSDLFGTNGYVEDEIFVVSSHSVYRDVARDLGIYKRHTVKTGFLSKMFKYKKYPVEIFAAPGIVDTLSTTIKFDATVNEKGLVDVEAVAKRNTIAEIENGEFPVTMDTEYGKFILNKTSDYPEGKKVRTIITITGYDAAAEDLSEEVMSDIASKKSNVIALSINTTDSEFGRDVLNEIIKKYNQRGINEKNLQGEKTAAFIDDRLALISVDLAEAETDIQNYKQSQGIVDVTTEASYNIRLKSNAEIQLINAQTTAEVIKMTRDFIANPTNAYDLLPATVGEDGLQTAIQTYNQLLLKRIEMMNNAKPNNVALKQLTDQIDAMRASINTSLDKAYENSLVAIRDLRAEVSRAQGKLGNIPTQEREFLNMKRQQEVKQQLYLFLLQRREETAMLLANSVPKGVIIDEAYTLREPVGMGKFAILAIAMVLGLCIPPVIIYLQKIIRDKFSTREEVEKLTDVPIIGEMCSDRSGRQLVVNEHDTSSTSELFRLMRVNLQFILNGANDKVVLMTSTQSGEGKSFISINLAASLALLGKKVLLIGMDIRNPRLSEYLEIPAHTGLTQYLSTSGIKLSDIIIPEPKVANMDIIVAGPIPPNPGELLASQSVDAMFTQLRSMYDYIIVDTAPVGMVSDTFTLNRISDATVYVCRANYSSTRDINFVNSIYEDGRLKKLSLVVNGTTVEKGYGYGYGQGHKGTK